MFPSRLYLRKSILRKNLSGFLLFVFLFSQIPASHAVEVTEIILEENSQGVITLEEIEVNETLNIQVLANEGVQFTEQGPLSVVAEAEAPTAGFTAFMSSFSIQPAAAALPPESNFISRQANGVYEMAFDDYMGGLLQQVMPASATAGFSETALLNVELEFLKTRIYETLANQYDFIVMLPTASARSRFENLEYGGAELGIEGLGAATRGGITGLGENDDNDAIIEQLNNTFGPLFEDNFSSFMYAVNEQSALQGMSWVDFTAIDDYSLSTSQYYRYVLLHELNHRWGTRLSSTNANSNPLGILGRDSSHWSPFFDAGNSPMDGMDWRDNGNGTFTLQSFFGIPFSQLVSGIYTGQTNQFNDFDLYAMGLLAPAQVNSSFVIDNPRTMSNSPLTQENFSSLFSDINFLTNPTIQGTRRTITIQNIIDLNGTRTPDAAVTQKSFSVAFVTLKTGFESSSDLTAHRSKVTTFANNMSSYWSAATRNLSTMTTGALTGAFETFRSNVLSVFDETANAINTQKNELTAQGTAKKDQITQLQSQIAAIEALLAPMLTRAQTEPAFNQALGTMPGRVQTLKQNLADYKAALETAITNVSGISTFMNTRRTDLNSLVSQAQTSGILPLGFAAGADLTMEGIENQYAGLTPQLTTAIQNYETAAAAIITELNQIQAKVSADTTAPTGNFTINNGASKTSTGVLSLRANFADSQLGPAYMRYSLNRGQSWSEFQNYTSNAWPIEQWYVNGTHFALQVQVCDFFWNCSSSESSIQYDYNNDQTAPGGGFTINGGASTTNTGNLTLNLNFTDNATPVQVVRYSTNLNQPWSSWSTQTNQIQFSEWHVNGTNFGVWVQACDFSWNCSTAFNSIQFNYQDNSPPSGSIAINNGAPETGNGNLAINLNLEDNVTPIQVVRYSTNLNQPWSAWSNQTSQIQVETWPPQGTNYGIWVQACDYSWNCNTFFDTILFSYLDSNPPTGNFQINNGAATASGGSMTLNFDFHDNETKVTEVRYSKNRGESWNAFQAYTPLWIIAELVPEILVQVCDVAGNCTSASDTILVS